jgi:periplasmic protein TorT
MSIAVKLLGLFGISKKQYDAREHYVVGRWRCMRTKIQKKIRTAVYAFALPLIVGSAIFTMPTFEAQAKDKWYPIKVDVWEPPFNDNLERKSSNYVALEEATKRWRLCASIPHLKDPYWSAVNFGLIDEAKRLGVGLRLVEAGGYDHGDNQRQQIITCMASGADALIVSSISADGVNDLVEKYVAAGKIVIDMINGMSSKKMTARVGVNFFDPGFAIARHIVNMKLNSGKPVKVAWFPGPDGPTWVDQGDRGFNEGLKNSTAKIVVTAKGDTGRATQGALVKKALDEHKDIDVITGTTVTAEAAIDLLRRRKLQKKVKVLAYYYGPGVHRGIKRGSIVAAPTDLQSVQARIAVDLAVRALEGRPFLKHVGPKVIVVDRGNIKSFDESTSLPPRGFRPIFSINDW